MAHSALVICSLLAVVASARAMDTVANAVPIYNGFSKVDDTDILKGDLACNGQKFCKVCYTGGDVPKGPMSFDQFGKTGEKTFYWFSEECRKKSGCQGFTFEKANPLCAFLKEYAKAANLNGRPGWVAVSTQISRPAPDQCKGGRCGGKRKMLHL